MLLRSSSGFVETRPPRLWSLGVAAGLLSLAALVAGVGPRAAAAPDDQPARTKDGPKEEPKKEQPDKKADNNKKEEPKKEADDFPEFERILKNLPPGMNAEQIKMMREQMKRSMEMMKQFQAGQRFGGFAGGAVNNFNPFGAANHHEGRLGAVIKEPSATLVDQLDLPKGQGMVIEDVTAGSAAAKAGLKANDILLELAGKPVASNAADLVKMINGLKADKPIDAVVMRKGKKETIKGISLPEAKQAAAPAFPGFAPIPPVAIPVPAFGGAGGAAAGGVGGLPGMAAAFGGAGGVMTTVFRSGDNFTARHQEGNLIITVTGTVTDGKAKTKTIGVQDGAKREKYESVDKVPEEYRDKVKSLVEMGEKGAAKVEIK